MKPDIILAIHEYLGPLLPEGYELDAYREDEELAKGESPFILICRKPPKTGATDAVLGDLTGHIVATITYEMESHTVLTSAWVGHDGLECTVHLNEPDALEQIRQMTAEILKHDEIEEKDETAIWLRSDIFPKL